MIDIMVVIFRWIASIALLYGAYTETGIWTVIVLGLITLHLEIQDWISIS